MVVTLTQFSTPIYHVAMYISKMPLYRMHVHSPYDGVQNKDPLGWAKSLKRWMRVCMKHDPGVSINDNVSFVSLFSPPPPKY